MQILNPTMAYPVESTLPVEQNLDARSGRSISTRREEVSIVILGVTKSLVSLRTLYLAYSVHCRTSIYPSVGKAASVRLQFSTY